MESIIDFGVQGKPEVAPQTGAKKSNPNNKVFEKIEKIAGSKLFQKISEMKRPKQFINAFSNTKLALTVSLESLDGTLVVNVPPPPADIIWFGLAPATNYDIKVTPNYGKKEDFFFHTRLINMLKKRFTSNFRKTLILPNMESIYINMDIKKMFSDQKKQYMEQEANFPAFTHFPMDFDPPDPSGQQVPQSEDNKSDTEKNIDNDAPSSQLDQLNRDTA